MKAERRAICCFDALSSREPVSTPPENGRPDANSQNNPMQSRKAARPAPALLR
jgi:hypothetical protein